MSHNIGQIIRKHQVKVTGSRRLDLDAPRFQQPQSTDAAKSKPAAASSQTPQVRIVENNPQGMVLEFTCSCGLQTHIKCDYTPAV
jgi:hypothetical protein